MRLLSPRTLRALTRLDLPIPLEDLDGVALIAGHRDALSHAVVDCLIAGCTCDHGESTSEQVGVDRYEIVLSHASDCPLIAQHN